MPTELEKRIGRFNTRYGARLSVDSLENATQKKWKVPENRLFNKKSNNKELKNYLSGLTQTLTECIKGKLKINDEANYAPEQINILSFIQDYEDIMKARKEEAEYDRQRSPYEGADYKELVKYVVDSTKEFDQALCWIWAEDVVNEKLSIKDLKAVSDRAIADLDSLREGDEFGDKERAKLANVYWSMKAMEMVRQQRGFFFKIFSFRINGREKEYFNQLVAAKDRFIARGFPVAEIQKTGYASVMKEAYEDVEKGLKQGKPEKEIRQEKAENLRSLPKVTDVVQPLMQNSELKAEAAGEIVDKLPQCRWEKNLQKAILLSTMMDTLLKAAKDGNQVFDEEAARGGNRHALMAHNVKLVFKAAFLFTGSLGYMETSSQIVAAQIMTDVIIQHYSPALIDPKEYAYFTEGYMFKEPNAVGEILKDLDTKEEYFINAEKKYYDLKREEIKITEVNVIENKNVVAPIEQTSSVKETITIKK
jgi:hypothetical protein